jgi:hypothetical protein
MPASALRSPAATPRPRCPALASSRIVIAEPTCGGQPVISDSGAAIPGFTAAAARLAYAGN